MVSRQQSSAPATGLVRRVEETALTVSQEATEQSVGALKDSLKADFSRAVESTQCRIKGNMVPVYSCAGVTIGTGLLGTMLAGGILPVSPLYLNMAVAMTVGVSVTSVMLAIKSVEISYDAQKRGRNLMNLQIEDNCRALRKIFRDGQEHNMRARQDELIALVDAELKQKRLLDGPDMAVLAALPRKRLKDASDALAISVLQARGMLACYRGQDVQEPLTFKCLQLNPALEKHNKILRAELARQADHADWRLSEDDVAWEVLDLGPPPTLEIPGFWGRLGRAFAAPLYRHRDLEEIGKLELPALPDIPVLPLPVAEDFTKALAHYERHNEPLDLPVMRRPAARMPSSLPPVLRREA